MSPTSKLAQVLLVGAVLISRKHYCNGYADRLNGVSEMQLKYLTAVEVHTGVCNNAVMCIGLHIDAVSGPTTTCVSNGGCQGIAPTSGYGATQISSLNPTD